MKSSFMLPSCNYNIGISKAELETLITKGHLMTVVSKTPCVTGRAVMNEAGTGLETIDRKPIYNDLKFYLEEDVADLHGGDWGVQFLTINIIPEEAEHE